MPSAPSTFPTLGRTELNAYSYYYVPPPGHQPAGSPSDFLTAVSPGKTLSCFRSFIPPHMLRHVSISRSSSGLVHRAFGSLRSYHDESFGFRKPRIFTHADCEYLTNFPELTKWYLDLRTPVF